MQAFFIHRNTTPSLVNRFQQRAPRAWSATLAASGTTHSGQCLVIHTSRLQTGYLQDLLTNQAIATSGEHEGSNATANSYMDDARDVRHSKSGSHCPGGARPRRNHEVRRGSTTGADAAPLGSIVREKAPQRNTPPARDRETIAQSCHSSDATLLGCV